MTTLYITIDTEYSSRMARLQGGRGRQDNFDRSIRCVTPEGEAGIHYQMDILDRHGLRAVFFVDPMPSLLWGIEATADVVGPILARGHDVQLHLHTEWLALTGNATPFGARTGNNIKDFPLDEQCRLLDYGRSVLMAAGAPPPSAFRAGNYGANDDTLRALAQLGMSFDTSHPPGIAKSACDISLGREDRLPRRHCGVIEVPIGCIGSYGGQPRHAQVTAISAAEICAALRHANAASVDSFTLVSHSFELLSRDRTRINRIVRRRFERLCTALSRMPEMTIGTYAGNPPRLRNEAGPAAILPPNLLRTGLRFAEQAFANALYGAR